ncbi:M1 family metallopeptidase [Sphingomicrobium clamense]|uniref:M1 family metallopeptidase n=1 Tax=Sphingomicrobium clamense TaxID=2851013 RepID=A0ABS6V8K9_9SPHN|nr:M1 family metallopeptidase [Sphingomicrobium sp. B8]MBW0145492.1 M1 family metallopeptidase [Sphingomicrobium sp. B8]
MSETTGKERDWMPWAIITLLAAVFLALFLTKPTPPAPLDEGTEASGRLLSEDQQSVRFTHADLSFDIDPKAKAIAARAVHRLDVTRPIENFQVDLDPRYDITEFTVNGTTVTDYVHEDGQLRFALPERLDVGDTLEIAIAYEGKPHVARRAPWDGGFVWSSHNGKPWIATAVQGEGCDLFWPCYDNPMSEFETVELHITVPEGLSAPANGVLQGIDENDDGTVTWHWKSNQVNSYNVALNVGPYEELRGSYDSRYGNTIPLHFWYLEGNKEKAEELFAEWPDVIDFFESQVGPYPFADEKLAAVETPHLGMEHQTINAYGNHYTKTPEGYDWLFHHELAHEWFGNQVSNRNWDEMWIHEGFGAYMQPYYLRWRDGEMAYLKAMSNQRSGLLNRAPIVSNSPKIEHEVYEIDKGGPASDIYAKGSWVLHTLRELIGDEAFNMATRRLVYGRPDPQPGNFKPRFGTSAEFQQFAEEESGRDLDWFFDVYLYGAALPELVTERDGNQLTVSWKVPGDIAFPMPVDITVDGAPQTLAMTGGSETITLPDPRARVVLDPRQRILKVSKAIDRYQEWQRGSARPIG